MTLEISKHYQRSDMLLKLLMPIAAKLWLYEKIQIESHEQFGNLCALIKCVLYLTYHI